MKSIFSSAIHGQYTGFVLILLVWGLVQARLGTPYPFNYDSVNYALAISDRFDIGIDQPHPPGYFFHVLFGKLIYAVYKNPIRIQQLQSLFYLLISLVGWQFAMKRQKGTLFFLGTLPLVLFFSAAPVIHGASLMFGSWIALAIHKMEKGEWPAYVLGLIFSISLGFRLDMATFMGPVVLFALVINRRPLKDWIGIATIGAIVTLLWYVPTRLLSHGLDPISMTSKTNMVYFRVTSFFLGAPFAEHARCAIRWLIYSLGVVGPGGAYVVWRGLRGNSGRDLIILLLGTVPVILFGVLFLFSFSQYYAPALGFFMTWCFVKNEGLISRKIILSLVVLNLLFFWFVPRPRYEKWHGEFSQRSFFKNIQKQLLYVGANGRKNLVFKREVIRFAETKLSQCGSFYADERIIGGRILSYLSKNRWRNKRLRSPQDAECILTTKKKYAGSTIAQIGNLIILAPLKKLP